MANSDDQKAAGYGSLVIPIMVVKTRCMVELSSNSMSCIPCLNFNSWTFESTGFAWRGSTGLPGHSARSASAPSKITSGRMYPGSLSLELTSWGARRFAQ